MSEAEACPRKERLVAWAVGELLPSEAETVELHVTSCDTCRVLLDKSCDDPIVDLLRDLPTDSSAVDSDPELLRALEKARQLSSELRRDELSRPEEVTGEFEVDLGSLGLKAQRQSPAKLGRYSILGTIDSGGMGVVLKARDPDLDRLVAIKVMKPTSVRNDDARKRFLREARAAATIQHPNVCPIYDVGEHAGSPYVVMAIVEGQSLEHRLRAAGRYDSLEDAVGIARQIAEAMDAVHSHGIVHRDLKPANILIDSNGHAVVTDFGLAIVEEEVDRLTVDGSILGTPAYMAPEQAAGDSDKVRPRTDIYALGVILYDVLTGQTPFTGAALQVLCQIANEDPPPPSQLRPDLNRDLERIVLKALSRRPEDRYQSAKEMNDALGGWLANQSTVTLRDNTRAMSDDGETAIHRSIHVDPPDGEAAFAGDGDLAISQTVSLEKPQGRSGRRRWGLGIATAAAMLLVVAGAVFAPQIRKIIVRDNQGNKKAEIVLEKDDTAELQENDKTVVVIPGRQEKSNNTSTTESKRTATLPLPATVGRPALASGVRVTKDLALLYLFQEGKGSVIRDASNVGEPLDLQIVDESNVRWVSGGGLALERATVAASEGPASKVLEACQASNELTIEAWVRPKVRNHNTGASPARIVSLSNGPLEQDFVFGQSGIDIEVRLRTTRTDLMGRPATMTPWDSHDRRPTHGVLTRDKAGDVRVYVDGVSRGYQKVTGDFSNWAAGHRFCLGNEPTEDRPWLGEYYLVAVYSRALTEQEVLQNYTAGIGGIAITCLLKPDAVADQEFEVTWTDEDAGDGIITWYCSRDAEGRQRQRIVTLFHDDFEDGATDRWQPLKHSKWKVVRDPNDPANLVVQGRSNLSYLGSRQLDFSDVVASARILGRQTTAIPGLAIRYDPTNDSPGCYRLRFSQSTFSSVDPGFHLWKQPGNLSIASTEYQARLEWTTYEVAARNDGDGTVELTGWALSPDNNLLARISTTDDAKGTHRPNNKPGGIALYGAEFFDDVYVDPVAARLVRDRENRFVWDTSRLQKGDYFLIAEVQDSSSKTTVVSSQSLKIQHAETPAGVSEQDRAYTWSKLGSTAHEVTSERKKSVPKRSAPVAVSPPSASDSPPLAVAPFDEATAQKHQRMWADYLAVPVEREIDLPGGQKLTLVLIPPGEFLMGSTAEEQQRFMEEARTVKDQYAINRIPHEGPQHPVPITTAFYLGKYEVTQAQWQAVMGSNPSKLVDKPTHPVEMVSWDDIQSFLTKLNDDVSAQEITFALPTEAQWEYACRAGTTTAWYSGDGEAGCQEHGWFEVNSSGTTHPVGQLRPNAFAVYDMHGNVSEWCADRFATAGDYTSSPLEASNGDPAGPLHLFRGGNWRIPALHGRSAYRGHTPGNGYIDLGFRLAAPVLPAITSPAKPAGGEPNNVDEKTKTKSADPTNKPSSSSKSPGE